MRLSDQFFAFYAKRLVRTASYFFLKVLTIDKITCNILTTYMSSQTYLFYMNLNVAFAL